MIDFCEDGGIGFVLSLLTNTVLRADHVITKVADACATQRAEENRPVLRLFAETRYAAKSWNICVVLSPNSRPALRAWITASSSPR